ncbi:aspartyl-phosphate phosphatase Spo0E family protein [Pseudalkalibacillus hwajinpoensis]|uniref:aspartyl-phosphate phosphatase Spo0E family protein n=1 Tax=Guptibacillus hwajinpoensis TaxID=208199 RepID=UPI00325AC778
MNCEKMQQYNEEIEILRAKMTQSAIALGLNHPEVLEYSQKLDETHNLILQLKYKYKAKELSIPGVR